MSRGFDGFEIDDFRDSQWESEPSNWSRESSRGRGSSSQTEASVRIELVKLREAEYQSDHLDLKSRERPEAKPLSLSRDIRQADLLAQRERTEIHDGDRSYSLRPSEIHTLTEVGKFRVVAVEDIAKHAYAGDRSRLDSDLRNLIHQRLVERRDTSVLKKESQQVLTLTKEGKRLIRRHGFVARWTSHLLGLCEAKRSGSRCCLIPPISQGRRRDRTQRWQGTPIQLDYELKEKLYRKLGQAQGRGEEQIHGMKEALARQLHLPVVNGKVSFPDLRIEYANQEMEISRVDLELATGHYHAGHLAEKARAGFQIYARPEDAVGLRRVRDDREIMTAILSL